MGRLIVRRNSHFLGMARKYKIWIDGKEVGSLKNGQNVIINLTEGSHTIRTGISAFSGMSSTITITINANSETIVETGANNVIFAFMVLSMIGGAIFGYGLRNFIFLLLGLVLVGVGVYFSYKSGIKIEELKS